MLLRVEFLKGFILRRFWKDINPNGLDKEHPRTAV